MTICNITICNMHSGFEVTPAICKAFTTTQCAMPTIASTWWTDSTLHWLNIWGGLVCQPANAETSYIWSGLGDTIFPPFSTILLVVDARIPFPSLYDFLVKYLRPIFETSQKLRIPQGWACSGGIGPNLFEEEIGKCENHKFQTNFPSVEICDVQYVLINA